MNAFAANLRYEKLVSAVIVLEEKYETCELDVEKEIIMNLIWSLVKEREELYKKLHKVRL